MIQEHFGTLERCLPLKFGRCACTGMFWTFVGGLESADDELSGREKARGDSYSEWGLVEM